MNRRCNLLLVLLKCFSYFWSGINLLWLHMPWFILFNAPFYVVQCQIFLRRPSGLLFYEVFMSHEVLRGILIYYVTYYVLLVLMRYPFVFFQLSQKFVIVITGKATWGYCWFKARPRSMLRYACDLDIVLLWACIFIPPLFLSLDCFVYIGYWAVLWSCILSSLLTRYSAYHDRTSHAFSYILSLSLFSWWLWAILWIDVLWVIC